MKKFGMVALAIASLMCLQHPVFAQARQSPGNRQHNAFSARQHQVSVFGGNQDVQLVGDESDACMADGACSADCDEPCGVCETEECCCPEFWEHRTGLFGEFLYLETTDVDLQYATEVIPGNTGMGDVVTNGQTFVANPEYQPGFRLGGSYRLSPTSSIRATYWFYESNTDDSVSLPGGGGNPFLRRNLAHPGTASAGTGSLDAESEYDIDFQMADLDYSGVIWGGCNYVLNYNIGVRYANLEQESETIYDVNSNIETIVSTDIDFDGVGPRLGLNGERLLCYGLLLYAKGNANFLAGEFRNDYDQSSTTVVNAAAASFEDDRIVTQLEMELGAGWQSRCGNLRVTAGYYIGGWFNTITTPEFIDGVQSNEFDDLDDTITFHGLTARAEYRF